MATTCVEHAELCLLVAAGDVDKDWFLLQVTNGNTASGHVTTILVSDWQDWLRGDLPNTNTFTLAVVRRRLATTGHTTSNTVEKGQNQTKLLPSVS